MSYVDPQGRAWGTLRALADAHGVHPYTLGRRLRQGWGMARALTPRGVVHPVTGDRVTLRALAAEVGITHGAMAYRDAAGVDLLIPKMDRRAAGAVRRK